jgi:hypothetical protein
VKAQALLVDRDDDGWSRAPHSWRPSLIGVEARQTDRAETEHVGREPDAEKERQQ